ncbi:MAG: hypothetical protein ACLQDC_06455 [Verrucomicrobiia bacterium]
MKRFSYSIVCLSPKWTPEDEQAQLNEAGQRGCELVSVITKLFEGQLCTFYYFIHEIPEHDGSEAEDVIKPLENKEK